MTPQSSFVKDECCRLIRKGVYIYPHLLAMKKFRVYIIGVIFESIVGCRFVVRVEVGDGDRCRDRGRQGCARAVDSRA